MELKQARDCCALNTKMIARTLAAVQVCARRIRKMQQVSAVGARAFQARGSNFQSEAREARRKSNEREEGEEEKEEEEQVLSSQAKFALLQVNEQRLCRPRERRRSARLEVAFSSH